MPLELELSFVSAAQGMLYWTGRVLHALSLAAALIRHHPLAVLELYSVSMVTGWAVIWLSAPYQTLIIAMLIRMLRFPDVRYLARLPVVFAREQITGCGLAIGVMHA